MNINKQHKGKYVKLIESPNPWFIHKNKTNWFIIFVFIILLVSVCLFVSQQ